MASLAQGQQSSAVYWLVNSEPYRAVFNDPSDPDNVGTLAGEDGITGLDSPDIREAAADLAEAHGGIHGDFWSSRRPVTITAQITPNQASTIDSREVLLERAKRASFAFSTDATLIWFPGDPDAVATTRRNLVVDPSFEGDVVGNAPGVIQTGAPGYGALPVAPWVNTTDAAITGQIFQVAANNPLVGANALRLNGTKDNTVTARSWIADTASGVNGMPVVAGRTYSAQASVFIADAAVTGGPGARLDIRWFDANGTLLSTDSSNTIAVATTGRQTLTANGKVAPANASYAQLRVIAGSTTALDVVNIFIDAVQFEEAAAVGAYFDGDTAGASWLGLAGFSPSVNRPNARFITVRRQQPYRVSGLGYNKTIFIPLVAADPRIYSTKQYRAAVATGAFSANLENQGNFEAPVVLRGYGPANLGTQTHTLTSRGANRTIGEVRAAPLTALVAGDFVEFDTRIGSVRKNPTAPNAGGTSERGYLDFVNVNWWGLVPGAANLYLKTESGGGTTAASLGEIRWRDTWL